MFTSIAFWLLAVIAVVSGAAVFRVDSMARATYALAVSFVAVGAILLLFDLDYVGVITILMMMMEMAIMGVFMIMFMGMNPALMPMDMVHSKKASAAVSLSVFVMLSALALLIPWPSRRGSPDGDVTAALGEALMESKMLVMLVISSILFATIVASLVLANPGGRYGQASDGAIGGKQRARHPDGGGK
ncbi:NADH-quinone oxidoreductase subunit J [Arthrobacter sp. H14]|uniref:NADH-quinone oxidoreductase subunit J n=1 Tax=Arthrobacter sp. H14 TaxID=1312959 RepID=UPI000478B8CD|nr:NADH-quinone oxidoreductase subunit J [Arthrobacter sp. H14]